MTDELGNPRRWDQEFTCGCHHSADRKKLVPRRCPDHPDQKRKGKPVRNSTVRKRKEKILKPKVKRVKPMTDPMMARLTRNRTRIRAAIQTLEEKLNVHGMVISTNATWSEIGRLQLIARGLESLIRLLPSNVKDEKWKTAPPTTLGSLMLRLQSQESVDLQSEWPS